MFAITRRGGLKAIHSPAWCMGWEVGWRQNLNHRDLIEHRVVLCVVSSISTTLRWPDSLVVRQKGRTATMDVWLRVSAFVISYAISSEYIEREPRALFHTLFVKRTRLNPRSISVFFFFFFSLPLLYCFRPVDICSAPNGIFCAAAAPPMMLLLAAGCCSPAIATFHLSCVFRPNATDHSLY